MKFLSGLALVLMSQGAFAQQELSDVTICTKDLNAWGKSSFCRCVDEEAVYDSRVGKCLLGEKHNVEFEGIIETGRVAIGGETTGTELLTNDNYRYDLLLSRSMTSTIRAGTVNGRVTVNGYLVTLPGVERGDRDGVVVTSLTIYE